MRVTFTPKARADLVEIGDYIARDNPIRALSFISELEQKCMALAEFDHRGVPREDIRAGLRSLPFGRYVIFYRTAGDRVDIVRVLHSARDIRSSFDGV